MVNQEANSSKVKPQRLRTVEAVLKKRRGSTPLSAIPALKSRDFSLKKVKNNCIIFVLTKGDNPAKRLKTKNKENN